MYRFLSNILFVICYLVISQVTQAGPVVIWNGTNAKFLNSGTIQVPGLAPGGVCKVDGSGLFSAGTISPSSVSGGTANTFAGYDGSGLLSDIPTWIHNTYGGADETLSVTPTDIGSTLSIPYNNSTLNISPTNNLANTYLWQNLDQINLNGTNDFLAVTGKEIFITQAGNNNVGSDLTVLYPRIQLGVGGSGTSQTSRGVFATIRESGTHVANTMTGVKSDINQDSGAVATQMESYNGSTYVGGTTNYAYGINQNVGVDGTVNTNLVGANIGVNISGTGTATDSTVLALGFSGDHTGSFQGIGLNTIGDTAGGSAEINIYREGQITGNSQIINIARNGAYLNGVNSLNFNFNSSSPTTGEFRFINGSNDATVSNNAAGSIFFMNGTIGQSWTGYGSYINADAGDGTSNINGFDFSTQNHTIAGNIFGLNMNNNSTVTGNNTIQGVNINNQGTGYRFTGVGISNNQNMSEEIRGFMFNSQNANARTGTGLDISMSGAFIDDVQGIRVNMNNVTTSSTTQHVHSGEFNGGTFNVQSAYTPFSGANVEVGNNITMTASVQNGAPLTGTDTLVQLFQSNLLVHDDIATGPFGLDTNMVAMSSQIAVDSGKTVPLVRSLLLGTTTPSGSGGFITDHVVLELLGLPSFGGSVTNTNRWGIRDSQLIGANFCDGVTGNCYFMDVRDPNALIRSAGDVVANSFDATGGSISSDVSMSLSANGDMDISANQINITADQGGTGAPLNIKTQDTSGVTSGSITSKTGQTGNSANTGDQTITTGDAGLGFTSGSLFLKTGVAGTGGSINLQPDNTNNDSRINLYHNTYLREGRLIPVQSTAPTTTVNANAGTGATCSIDADSTDIAGTIELTTGSGAWASGNQCSINHIHGFLNPKCVLFPENAKAAGAATRTYVVPGPFEVTFTTADTSSNTYRWNYICSDSISTY